MREMTNDPAVDAATAGFSLDFSLAGTEDALCFPLVGDRLLLTEAVALPSPAALAPLGSCQEALLFGRLDGQPCELRFWPATTPLPAGLQAAHYRQLWGHWREPWLGAASRALQLATWLSQNRFCGVCGSALRMAAQEPARVCPACGFKAYPRVSPVCIGLVRRGDSVLLARSPHFPPGIYSALAGFVEPGESAEACLRREIREEAGIEIANPRWFGSQAWPYPHSLMMGFLADHAAGEPVPQAGEIEDVRWFPLAALPPLPHPSTIAFRMIAALRAGSGG